MFYVNICIYFGLMFLNLFSYIINNLKLLYKNKYILYNGSWFKRLSFKYNESSFKELLYYKITIIQLIK